MDIENEAGSVENSTSTLRDACLEKALEAIREKGVEGLSLREVARRLNVSHQAPYKHFPSKDHLLAEVIRHCLRDFAQHLRASRRPEGGTPVPAADALRSLGQSYLGYAATHPLEYRLMFMTSWPEVSRELGLASDARAAFEILGETLKAGKQYPSAKDRDRDAMFIWSAIHGTASILQSEAMAYLTIEPEEIEASVSHGFSIVETLISPRQP